MKIENNVNNIKQYNDNIRKTNKDVHKIKRETKMSVHHIINKSDEGSNHFDNKVGLENDFHRLWHILFNNMKPHQIILLVLKVCGKSFKPGVVEEIESILSVNNPKCLYRKTVFKI